LRLLFPATYHHGSGQVDVRLVVSGDGRSVQWVSYDPIIELGGAGQCNGGSLDANANLVKLPDGLAGSAVRRMRRHAQRSCF
jgi:hypothetical protein